MECVFLSLGTNQGDKSANLNRALQMLENRVGDMLQVSSVYGSSAWGFDGDDFENLVANFSTSLAAQQVLEEILNIENEMGRIRSKNGYQNRLIDIDILYFGNWIVKSKSLIIPHPFLHQRNFVLKPLHEIAPDFVHPFLLKSTEELMKNAKDKIHVVCLR